MNLWAFALLDVLQLRRAGCSRDQIDRLATLRHRIQRGEISEFTLDTRRIGFVRWLVQRGRLSDDTPTASGGPSVH